MSYDKPNRQKYSFGTFDFGGAADDTFVIKGPKGRKGRLYDYGVEGTTEVFNGGTITPKIAVGTAADPDAYGDELVLHGLADASATSIRSLYRESDSGFATYMLDRNLPADTAVVVTCTVATGSPTGMGVPFVIIDWQD
jgi:hypothetical protein